MEAARVIPDDVLDVDPGPISPALLSVVLAEPTDAELHEPAGSEVEAVRRWAPTDLGSADWAGRKWARANRELDEIARLAAEQVDAIKRWEAGERRRLDRELSFWGEALARYGEGRREAEGVATVKLPSVRISTRKVAARLEVTDEAAALEWAEAEAPDAIKVERHLLKSKLPAWSVGEDADGRTVAVTEGGEIVPGVEPVAERISVKVEPA